MAAPATCKFFFGTNSMVASHQNLPTGFFSDGRLYTAAPTDDAVASSMTEATFGGYAADTDPSTAMVVNRSIGVLKWDVLAAAFGWTSNPTNLIQGCVLRGKSADRPDAQPQSVFIDFEDVKTMDTVDDQYLTLLSLVMRTK